MFLWLVSVCRLVWVWFCICCCGSVVVVFVGVMVVYGSVFWWLCRVFMCLCVVCSKPGHVWVCPGLLFLLCVSFMCGLLAYSSCCS